MSNLDLTKKSQDELEFTDDFRKYCPNIDEYSTISDFSKIRTFGIAGRILIESQYFVAAELIRTGRWQNISTTRVHCYDCDTVEDIKSIIYDEDLMYKCPYCESTNVITEAIPAYESEKDFIEWAVSELDVSKRTVLLRKEYIQKYIDMGLGMDDAFNGIAKWGLTWLFLTRRVEQKVKQEAMDLDEAQNVLANPEKFVDKGNVKRFQKKLEEKDDVEMIASPNSPDMVLQIVDPDGDIRFQIYYIAVPMVESRQQLKQDEFWDTAIGQMVAKKFKVMSRLTYSKGLDYAPDFKFYEEWERKVKIFSVVRDIVRVIINKTERIKPTLDEIDLKSGAINKVGYLLDMVKNATDSSNLEEPRRKIETIEEELEFIKFED